MEWEMFGDMKEGEMEREELCAYEESNTVVMTESFER